MNMIIETKNLTAMNEVFKRLNNLRRWTEITTNAKYDEISKQALNCIICFLLAKEAESKGVNVRWENFPKIAIFRAFQKAYVNYDTPEHILKEICALGEIDFNVQFNHATLRVISKKTNEEFAEWINTAQGTYEETIYRAATKIATLLELTEIRAKINGDYNLKYREIIESMKKYESVPGFLEMSGEESQCFSAFKSVSKLRNQNRWAAYSYSVSCSVLGHLFDTAVFAYWMCIESHKTEEIATKCFFMGIFHDIPEAFTRDIPSPIKDGIPGFRELTERYELLCMERKFYPKLATISETLPNAVKAIMFEDESNRDYKALMKGADYMSAVSEIVRQFMGGSRDPELVNAFKGHNKKFESGVASYTYTTEEMYKNMRVYVEELGIGSF